MVSVILQESSDWTSKKFSGLRSLYLIPFSSLQRAIGRTFDRPNLYHFYSKYQPG